MDVKKSLAEESSLRHASSAGSPSAMNVEGLEQQGFSGKPACPDVGKFSITRINFSFWMNNFI